MIDLTKFGGRYIPLIPNGKKPSMKFKNKEFDSEFLNNHFHNNGNFGLLAQPNFIFIDIDVSHGDDGMANFIKWLVDNGLDPVTVTENTLTAQTATGGFHLVYLQDKENHFKQDIGFLAGVDIKASPNNYIVVEPSVIDGKPYKWINQKAPQVIPAKLAQALIKTADDAKRQARIEIKDNGGDTMVNGLRYVQQFGQKQPQLDIFYTIEHGWGDQGGRNNNVFKWAQAMRYRTDQETTMRWAEVANNNSDEPLDIEEIDASVDSAYNFKQVLDTVEYKGYTFVKLAPDNIRQLAVTQEAYEKYQSFNSAVYPAEELLDTSYMSRFSGNSNSIYSYVDELLAKKSKQSAEQNETTE